MKARANTENKFLYKYLLIGIGTLLYSLYCYYDAFVNYPTLIPISAAHDQLQEEIETEKAESNDATVNWGKQREERWLALASQNGWPEKPPKNSADDVRHNINFSIGLGLVCTLISVPCIVSFFRSKGTWLEIDGETISSSSGQTVNLSDIQLLDKKKWVKKGLASVIYDDPEGGTKTFVLDDLKYERQVVDQIVAEIETVLPREKIVNGPTEAEIAVQQEEMQKARQARLAELDAGDDGEEEDS